MKTYYCVKDNEIDLIAINDEPPEGYVEVEVIEGVVQLPDELQHLYEARIQKLGKKGEIKAAKKQLAETDWVEPYILRHELNIEVLPEDSEKLKIHAQRIAWKALVSQ